MEGGSAKRQQIAGLSVRLLTCSSTSVSIVALTSGACALTESNVSHTERQNRPILLELRLWKWVLR
jgi:hypothetical protein